MAGVWVWLTRILKPGTTGASAASTKPAMMPSSLAPAGATVQVSRRYPLSSIFVMYCLVSLLVAVGAFKDNNNLLYWLFGLSMGMLIVSGIISGTMMMAVTARRLKLDDGQVGQPLRVRYEVTNISRWWPVFALQVREGTGDDDLLAQTKRSLWDRLRRSRKGVQVQPATSAEDEAQRARLRRALRGFIVHIPPRSTMVFEAITVPSARGRLTLDEFELGTGFPFGIIRKALVFTQPASTIIRPESVEVPAALFAPRQGRAGFGDRSSRAVRSGEDLFSVREYTPGDPASTIWWRATARAGDGQTTGPQMTVRQFSSGVTQRVWLRLSLSEDPSSQAGSERVLSRACSIIAEAHRRSLAVGMLLEQAGLKRLVQPRVGQGTAASLMNDLSLHRLDRSLAGGVRGEVAERGSNRAEQIHDIPAREGDIIITLGFEHPEQITLSSPGSRNSSLGPGSSTRDLVAAATNKAEGAL